jgi:demethylmenaquinone methyltransferase/2-methoxy-6-polyprenyl-1,4-benzoquinol methylase
MAPSRDDPPSGHASFGFSDIPREEKVSRVRAIFDRVAPRYDLMNDLMSIGLHRVWKDILADKVNPQPGEVILDLAGGTGDIARRMAKRAEAARKRRFGERPRIFVVDINREMLEAGRARGEDDLEWVCGDAENLPFPANFADAVTIAFGIRNVTDIAAALHDARRVLKPGGRFACLEFSKFAIPEIEPLYDAFSFHAIPAMGKVVANDEASYRYLVESIRRFPPQEKFAAMMTEAGLKRVSYQNLSGGVAAIHMGWALD